jgi:MFS family permease
MSTRAPQLLGRFGFKPLLIAGTAIIALGTFLMSFLTAESSYFFHLLPAFILMAIGFGVTFVSATVAATAGVPGEEAGLASGLINTSQQVGGALGLSILAVVASAVALGDINAGQSTTVASLHGYQLAFMVAALLMIIAMFIAIFVIRTPKQESTTSGAEPQHAASHV